jgi:hypothetical protein
LDEFERLRVESGATKDAAFFYLEQGTRDPFRSKLHLSDRPPTDYDTWVSRLTDLQAQYDKVGEYNKLRTPSYFPRYGQRQNTPAMPKGHGDPMDVDAINHRKGKPQQKPQPKPKSKFPIPKKTNTRLPPHPTAQPSSSRPRTSTQTTRNPRSYNCFICDQPGHYARDCKTSIAQIDHEHIRQLGLAMEATMDLQSQEGDYQEEEEMLEEELMYAPFEDADQAGDLISFEDPSNPHDENEDNTHGQGF